jgi:hypothetical protein
MGFFDPSAALGGAFAAFGIAAVYTAPVPGAAGVAVTILARREDEGAQFGAGRVTAARGLFEVRAAELALPAIKGLLAVSGETWRIEAAPEKLDPDRLVWTLRCIRVQP